ncbi:MAG: TatD family hydrolase [bacterium]|nr:TatD family hydrolase [bacterium]
MLIDSHCHVHFPAYNDDRKEVLDRARTLGIRMITVGTNLATSTIACELAQNESSVWASVGMHPSHVAPSAHDAWEGPTIESNFEIEKYEALARHPKVVAIGECGLDFYRIPETMSREAYIEKQEKLLRTQLDMAHRLDLPVIIHCRDAHEKLTGILKEYIDESKLARRGVIHCFTGTRGEAEKHVALGFYISFTGIVTFAPKKGRENPLIEAVKSVPADRILVETDAPYLAPEPYRGKRNEPAFVREVAESIARMRSTSFEEMAKQTTENAERLFYRLILSA